MSHNRHSYPPSMKNLHLQTQDAGEPDTDGVARCDSGDPMSFPTKSSVSYREM